MYWSRRRWIIFPSFIIIRGWKKPASGICPGRSAVWSKVLLMTNGISVQEIFLVLYILRPVRWLPHWVSGSSARISRRTEIWLQNILPGFRQTRTNWKQSTKASRNITMPSPCAGKAMRIWRPSAWKRSCPRIPSWSRGIIFLLWSRWRIRSGIRREEPWKKQPGSTRPIPPHFVSCVKLTSRRVLPQRWKKGVRACLEMKKMRMIIFQEKSL